MAKLMNCDFCGKKISINAHRCPRCGGYVQRRTSYDNSIGYALKCSLGLIAMTGTFAAAIVYAFHEPKK